jgi:serine protease inhibitor
VAAQRDSNVFISPISASMALGMTMNGAAGVTQDEMRRTLRFGDASIAGINAGYRGLIDLLTGLDPTTTFRLANSIWHDPTFQWYQPFLDLGRTVFDAEVRPLDRAAGVTPINQWASDKTEGRIQSVIDEIPDHVVMLLMNAIYFKGTWRQQFDPGLTSRGSFASVTGPQQVQMMRAQRRQMRLAQSAELTAGELPYGNGAFVMTVMVPTTNIETFASSLSRERFEEILGSLREIEGDVVMPRFRLEYERTLNDDLRALGMVTPFLPRQADFSGMSPRGRELYIDFVKQSSFVEVDERGTEAAAVTTVGIGVVSLPPGLYVDRPFVFVIRERLSGTILFVGKVVRIS